MDIKDIVAGLTAERFALSSYLESLPEDRWNAASACAGWSVRDVLCHLIGNADDTVSGRLDDFGSEAFNQRQVDQRAGRSPAELLAEWDEIAPKMEQLFTSLPDAVLDTELPAIGMSPRMGAQRLLEDLWVHAQDIRLPLGAGVANGPGVRAAAEIVVHDLRARIPAFAPEVGTLTIEAGDTRALLEFSGSTPVSIRGDQAAFALAGTGRTDIARATADGTLRIEPLVDGFGEALNIYGAPVSTPQPAARE